MCAPICRASCATVLWKLMTTLVNALKQRGKRYGLQTMCEGGGMANLTIVERL